LHGTDASTLNKETVHVLPPKTFLPCPLGLVRTQTGSQALNPDILHKHHRSFTMSDRHTNNKRPAVGLVNKNITPISNEMV